MVIYVDIDETICETPEDRDYTKSVPIPERIAKVNQLYENGHTIVYWTARGTKTGLEWTDLTRNQLIEWGAKFHDLKLGKPYYDLFVDDRNINTTDFFEQGWKACLDAKD